MGLFAGLQQYKASLHVHSSRSDGSATVASLIEEHYTRGYDILTITDHSTYANSMMTDWRTPPNGLTPARFEVITTGQDRNGRPMLPIPYTIEQSYHEHFNSYFVDYHPTVFPAIADDPHFVSRGRAMQYPGIPEQYTIDRMRMVLQEIDDQGGISFIGHPGRYTLAGVGAFPVGPSNDPLFIDKYVELFMAFPSCVGMSIINKRDGESRNDRILWDNINQKTIPRGRLVWGFSNDDSHANSEVGWSFNMMLMPALTPEDFRAAMQSGSFYGVARYARNEGVLNGSRDSTTPLIRDIEVSDTEITIAAENYTRIQWITEGTRPVVEGDTLRIRRFDLGAFVRANVIGPGGVAFTQPFRVPARAAKGPSMPIQVMSRMHVLATPQEELDVVRKADLADISAGVGFFSFEQEDGNLYFIFDLGVREDMFEFDDANGNLYYNLPEA